MADTIVYVRTWACPNCPFKPDHDPYDVEWFWRTFPQAEFSEMTPGKCPACYTGRNPQRQKGDFALEEISGTDLSALNQKRVADDATLELTQVDDTDENGLRVLEKVGVQEQIGIVNGKVQPVEVDVFDNKKRYLTDDELDALKLKRDQDLDVISDITVKQITE